MDKKQYELFTQVHNELIKRLGIEADKYERQDSFSVVIDVENGKNMKDALMDAIYDSCYALCAGPTIKKEGFRIIKLYFSMQEAYEIIHTNAPDTLIMAQLVYTNEREIAGEYVGSNYDLIQAMGYEVDIVNSPSDSNPNNLYNELIDKQFSYCDFYVSPGYR